MFWHGGFRREPLCNENYFDKIRQGLACQKSRPPAAGTSGCAYVLYHVGKEHIAFCFALWVFDLPGEFCCFLRPAIRRKKKFQKSEKRRRLAGRTVVHNHGAAARIGVIPRFLQSSVWDATDVKRLTCLPSRALEGRRGRQTIDSSAVPQILGCVRLPAAYSGCRSPPPIAPTGYHPAWRKYATRLSVGIMAAWRRRTVEEIPMMPQQPSPTHITAINRKYQEAENL